MDASRFIPVQKTSVIGLSASSLDLSVEEITSAKILEHLVRIHTMLAVVAGRGSDAHSNYCTLAWGFLSRLMQVCHIMNYRFKRSDDLCRRHIYLCVLSRF